MHQMLEGYGLLSGERIHLEDWEAIGFLERQSDSVAKPLQSQIVLCFSKGGITLFGNGK